METSKAAPQKYRNTSAIGDQNPWRDANHWAIREIAQHLRQIATLIERDGVEPLTEALADSLEPNALERLADALNQRLKAIK